MSLISVPNFSTYLTSSSLTDAWGTCVTGAGHAQIATGAPYPPDGHRSDHELDWKQGRILQHYQIVYITEGHGTFESTVTGPRKISPGTVFLLFPGVWHRYRPREDTGWVEDWIEFDGPSVHRLLEHKIISPEESMFNIGMRPEVLDVFYECYRLARSSPAGCEPVLAVLGLQILTRILYVMVDRGEEPATADMGIQRAQALIAAAIDQPVRMEEIAQDVGMGYSYFRRAFRARTGLSPKQYHLQLRMRQAQAMLLNKSMSIGDIADALGFDSPFHLSAAFKAKMGMSPTLWRTRALAQQRDPAA
jgi:AraC-like DNA-binding protein